MIYRSIQGVLFLSCVTLSFAMAGCGGEDVGQTEDGQLVLGRAEVGDTLQRGVAPGNRPLILNGFTGNVLLTATDAATASLEFVKRARADDTEAAQDLLGEIRIAESGDNEAYRYIMTTDAPGRTAVDVRGEVPEGTTLQVQWESGNVDLSGITGPITVRAANGNVHIEGAGANSEVEVQNGSVVAGYADLPQDAAVHLTVGNGNITLSLPAGASVRVDAQTSVGSINVGPGLEFVNRQFTPAGAGAQFSGQLNRGTAVAELRTENGVITIQEATPAGAGTAAPPPDTAAVDTAGVAPPAR